jgi:PhoH-like ATPase
MRTTYILDTSVLLEDPEAFKTFKGSDVVIPIMVVNELDHKKTSTGEVGKNARVCIRALDSISANGNIGSGIKLDDDIMLRVDTNYRDLNSVKYCGLGDPTYGDTSILACLLDTSFSTDTVLVSNDLNLRLKAKSRNIKAIGYETEKKTTSELYAGCRVIVNEQAGLELQKNNFINPNTYSLELQPHEFVTFTNEAGEELSYGRKITPEKIKSVKKIYPWGISAKNKEQSFAMDLIMDENIDLVTMVGLAGSGKSLITLASALELVLERKKYNKLVIYRPIQAVGNDIGFLPGELSEKLAPWFQAILDNFEYLFTNKSCKNTTGDWKRVLETYHSIRSVFAASGVFNFITSCEHRQKLRHTQPYNSTN